MRTARTNKMKVDLSKPIDVSILPETDDSCFGKEWDVGQKDCEYCSDNEVCGVLFSHRLKSNVEQIETEHTTFLDKSDFTGLNEEDILSRINGITSEEFFSLVKSLANTEDDIAVIEWIKRFIKSKRNISIKDKIVHVETETV